MKLDRKNIQKILFVGVVLIIVYLGLQHMNIIVEFLAWLLYVAMPFIVAICCSFFLNVPLRKIENHLFRQKGEKPLPPILDKLRRPVALFLSIAIFLVVIVAFLIVIIPEIGKSINSLILAIPDAANNINTQIKEWADDNDYVLQVIKFFNPEYGENIVQNGKVVGVNTIVINSDAITGALSGFLSNNAGGLVNYTMNMLSSVFNAAVNVFLGIVLSIYALIKKEKIASDVKKFIYAVLPSKSADFIVEVGTLTNKSFYNTITGQMMECVILGSLTALGMTILGFPICSACRRNGCDILMGAYVRRIYRRRNRSIVPAYIGSHAGIMVHSIHDMLTADRGQSYISESCRKQCRSAAYHSNIRYRTVR